MPKDSLLLSEVAQLHAAKFEPFFFLFDHPLFLRGITLSRINKLKFNPKKQSECQTLC